MGFTVVIIHRDGDIAGWSDSRNLVHANVDIFTHVYKGQRKKGIAIYEFWSDDPRQGNARRALKELRKTYSWIVVLDIGASPRAGTWKFWIKMAREGLVDELEDGENNIVFKRIEPK